MGTRDEWRLKAMALGDEKWRFLFICHCFRSQKFFPFAPTQYSRPTGHVMSEWWHLGVQSTAFTKMFFTAFDCFALWLLSGPTEDTRDPLLKSALAATWIIFCFFSLSSEQRKGKVWTLNCEDCFWKESGIVKLINRMNRFCYSSCNSQALDIFLKSSCMLLDEKLLQLICSLFGSFTEFVSKATTLARVKLTLGHLYFGHFN